MSSLLIHDPSGRESRVTLDPQRETVLGRDASCEVVLVHPSISRRHAVVSLREGASSNRVFRSVFRRWKNTSCSYP